MDWSKPIPVTDLDIAFAGNVIGKVLPPRSEIPEEYRKSSNPACQLAATWFFSGLKDATFAARDGISTTMAMRQIKACLGSFEPQHEDKEAGVAYLLALFFSEVRANGKTWKLELPKGGTA